MQAKATGARSGVRAYGLFLTATLATFGCKSGHEQASPLPPDLGKQQDGGGQGGVGAPGTAGGPGSGGGPMNDGGAESRGAPGGDGGGRGGAVAGSDGGHAGGGGGGPIDAGVLVQPQPGVVALPTSGTLAVSDLRTNDLKSPLGVDTAAPALSWMLTSDGYNQKQTDYRIEVAASAADLTAESRLLWDSGRVASDRNADIAYRGNALASRQRVYWRVRVWNGLIAADWSAPDFWEMGLLSVSDWSAQWIKRGTSAAGQGSAPMFAAQFQVDAGKEVARARLYISGLGLSYAEVNGRPVSDSYFDPSESDYRRRIFYCTYDVTSLVHAGTNALGFELGNGMYGNGVSPNAGRYEKSDGLALGAAGLHGTAKGIAQLEVTYIDGSTTTLATKGSWQSTDSPITLNTWYGGEDYDARRALQLSGWSSASNTFAGWTAAQLVPANELPSGVLRARPTPAIRIIETLSGDTVKRGQFASGDGWVDVSHNGAGFEGISFNSSLPATPDYAGVSLQFYPAEVKTATDVDQSSTRAGTAPVFDTYTFSGRETAGTKWNPRFVYHGYRYYKLVLNLPAGRTPTNYGFADKGAMLGDLMNTKLAFLGNIVRTDNAKTGSFTSSNATFNLIHTIVDRSIASQMYSAHTDCPHIEKLGWMETSHLMFPSIADTYDIRAWMSKIAQDAVDSQVTGTGDQQTQSGGSLGAAGYATAIAPPFQIITGLNTDPNWNGAIILTPWEHYLAYGNASVLRASYPAMQKYLRWLEARYAPTNYIINDAQMGEWGQYQVTTPTPLVVTAAFYRMADAMTQVATVLGDAANATAFAGLAAKIKTSFNATFFTASTNAYGSGTQASYAIPLFAGLVPDASVGKVADQLATVTQNLKYTITTGEIALRQMISGLIANGRSDVVYNIAMQPAQPGYRYMAETLGETTMTEYWNYVDQWGNTRSRNHDMMGHIQDWFTRGLAGIDRASPGYRDIVIKPYVPNNAALSADSRTMSAAATVGSTFGTISSGWQLAGDGSLTKSVTLPVGTTATVDVPSLGGTANTVMVSYGSVNEQVITGTLANGYIQVKGVPSGQYTFKRAAP